MYLIRIEIRVRSWRKLCEAHRKSDVLGGRHLSIFNIFCTSPVRLQAVEILHQQIVKRHNAALTAAPS